MLLSQGGAVLFFGGQRELPTSVSLRAATKPEQHPPTKVKQPRWNAREIIYDTYDDTLLLHGLIDRRDRQTNLLCPLSHPNRQPID